MTPIELFEQVILTNDAGKIKLMVKILDMEKDEALWRRLFTGIKFNNMEVLKLMFKEVKPIDMQPFKDYCTQHGNQRAAEYLSGRDPDAEAEAKRQKQNRARAKR